MRVVLVMGDGPGCGILPALIAALRRRAWTVVPALAPGCRGGIAPALLGDLCGCPPVELPAMPVADAIVLVPLSESHRAWFGVPADTWRSPVGRPMPVVTVPVSTAPPGELVSRSAGACRQVPPAVPLLGGGVGDLWIASPEAVCETVAAAVTAPDLAGQSVLVTAGPTAEDLDPVRYLTNRSSGLMGVALALAAWRRGAAVSLVHGPLHVDVPELPGLTRVPVRSAEAMHAAVMGRIATQAAAILCAAVADFTPSQCQTQKIKKDGGRGMVLELRRTPDILAAIGALPERPFLVGFAAETQDLQKHAADKLRRKNCDLLCANDVTEPGSGFAVSTNRITLLARDGTVTPLPLLSKAVAAERILDRVAAGLRQCQPAAAGPFSP